MILGTGEVYAYNMAHIDAIHAQADLPGIDEAPAVCRSQVHTKFQMFRQPMWLHKFLLRRKDVCIKSYTVVSVIPRGVLQIH
jgi:hypothetical protein